MARFDGYRNEIKDAKAAPYLIDVQRNVIKTESEFVSAMPITSTVKLPDGVVIDLPQRS